MNTSVQKFNFQNQPISAFDRDGQIWFVARDIALVLDYKNPRQALKSHVDAEDVQLLDTLTRGGKQKQSCVNESGLYALIFGSTKPEAKVFKRWVTSEVLPSIRKTGQYTLTITPEQQRQIQEAVNTYVVKHQTTHQSVYHNLKTRFHVAKYDQLPATKFNECIAWLGGMATRPLDNLRPALTHAERLNLSAYLNALENVFKDFDYLHKIGSTLNSDRLIHTWSLIDHARFIHGSVLRLTHGLVWNN